MSVGPGVPFSDADVETYVECAGELIRFAASLVGTSEAEDLFADAVLRAMLSPGWSSVVDRRGYLYRTVFNEAASWRRSAVRRRHREARVAPREAVTDRVVQWDLLVALRWLTVRQRAVIFLTYWRELPPVEIGEKLGVSTRTVERELTVARQRLRVALDERDKLVDGQLS